MTANERLVEKFLTDKTHITVEDCDKLLTSYSFVYRKSRGSHRAYHKKGEKVITVTTPKDKRFVKPGYIELIIKKLNLEG